MSEQIHADKAEEQVSADSGLLLSSEPLGGERLGALGDDSRDVDSTDTGGDTGRDVDSSDAGGDDGSDSLLGDDDEDAGGSGDADASDDEEDEADSDGVDGGDSIESESGLGGENPLGINRERVKNGDDRDTTENYAGDT